MEEVFNNKTVLKSIDYDQGVIIKNLITLHVPKLCILILKLLVSGSLVHRLKIYSSAFP